MPKRLYYADMGAFRGTTPSGKVITIRHLQHGQSKFEMVMDGKTQDWARLELVEDVLDIPVKRKHTGKQKGYEQEANLRAVWRYFVNRYNEYTPGVEPF